MQSGSSKCTVAGSSCSWWYPAAEKNPTENAKKQSFKIYSRNIPPPQIPLKDNLLPKIKGNFGGKKHKLKCREVFLLVFGLVSPSPPPFFLLSISLHILKLIRCLGTPDCVAPQPYICHKFRILFLKGWGVMWCLLWICYTWKARCIPPPNSVLVIFQYAFLGAGSSQVSDISLLGKCTGAFVAVSFRPVWSTCDSTSSSWKM